MPVAIFKSKGQDSSRARSSSNDSRGSDAESFDPIVRTAHWLTLFLILGIYATAFLMHRLPIAWTLTLQIHRSLGLTVWLVTVLRGGLASDFPLSGLACKYVKSKAMGSPGNGICSLLPSAFAAGSGTTALKRSRWPGEDIFLVSTATDH